MTEISDNVIIFPKWKKKLEEESLQALKEKRYEEALKKLDQLIVHHADDYEIITGKLICLMELNRFSEAQNLCEEALAKEDENYLHYIHIYLTILFQTNQYELLMEQIELEMDNSNLTSIQREQFQQLYDISNKMKIETEEDEIDETLDEFFQIIETNHYQAQWRLIKKLMKKNVQPGKEIIDLLVNDSTHPVIKTAIFLWLKEQNINQTISVSKFEKQSGFIPKQTEQWDSTYFYSETLSSLSDVEDNNPTLYTVMKKLLTYFSYVVYPFLPPEKDIFLIKDALFQLGKEYLNMVDAEKHQNEGNETIQYYKELIQLSESLYTSIIEP